MVPTNEHPIAALPALDPAALLRALRPPSQAFPFADPRTQYFHLGRSAVWHAIRLLHLRDEEILVPAYHHGVEIEALLDAGAKLRFYGVDQSFRADLANIAQQLTPQTKALYVIHYAGFPQPMDDLLAIARSRGLKVIEDCALSLFSADDNRPLGCRGDAAIFCLYKTLPVPHGGALWMPTGFDGAPLEGAGVMATAHQVLSSLLVRMENTGSPLAHDLRIGARAIARIAREVRPLPVDSRPVGNRRFTSGQEKLAISAIALGIARRANARDIVDQRRRNYYALLGRLRDVSTPMVHELGAGVCPLFYPLWCDDKRAVQQHLATVGIETIDFWREGSSLVPGGRFPEVDSLRAHVLELPIHQDLNACDISRLANAVRDALVRTGQAVAA